MKKIVYILIGLLSFSIWSCHPTWWEVNPTEIYSPADFSKHYRVIANKDSITIEFSTNLKKSTEDRLGVYLYDDLALLTSQLTKIEDTIKEDTIKRDSGEINKWKEVKMNNGIAKVKFSKFDTTATYYLLPVLQRRNTKTTFTNYFSNKFLRIQLSPWSRAAVTSSIDNTNIHFFTDSLSLFYVSKDVNNISFFKLDTTTNYFNQTGLKINTQISPYTGSLSYIKDILDISYLKEQDLFRLIITFYISRFVFTGEIFVDNNFNVVKYQDLPAIGIWNGNTQTIFKKVYNQNDTLHVFYDVLYGNSRRIALSLKTKETLFNREIDCVSSSKVAFLGNNVLVKCNNKSNFTMYDSYKNKKELDSSQEMGQDSNSFAVENDKSVYISAGQDNSKLYNIKVNSGNEIFYNSTKKIALRPSSYSYYQYYDQGLIYRGNLILFYQRKLRYSSNLSPSEVWQINPNRTNINLQNPYIKVISTNR